MCGGSWPPLPPPPPPPPLLPCSFSTIRSACLDYVLCRVGVMLCLHARRPTLTPTLKPTWFPSNNPSQLPSTARPSWLPSSAPSPNPTWLPSTEPTTPKPSTAPSIPPRATSLATARRRQLYIPTHIPARPCHCKEHSRTCGREWPLTHAFAHTHTHTHTQCCRVSPGAGGSVWTVVIAQC